MEIKYTKDGKKVAVLGKLNDTTWIVQEIYISNGQELPCGENFITKTLLNEPSETWQSKQVGEIEKRRESLKLEIEKLKGDANILRRKSQAAELINKATEKYENLDAAELDTLFAFLSGRITHIVLENYSDYEIVSIIEALKSVDTYRYPVFEGLKLVTLFGCNEYGERWEKDRTFRLDWKINQYRDGSGSSWNKACPCKSHKDAVLLLDSLVGQKEKATEKLILLKEKYNLNNPSQKKTKEYKNRCIKDKKDSIKKSKAELNKKEAELKAIESSQS